MNARLTSEAPHQKSNNNEAPHQKSNNNEAPHQKSNSCLCAHVFMNTQASERLERPSLVMPARAVRGGDFVARLLNDMNGQAS